MREAETDIHEEGATGTGYERDNTGYYSRQETQALRIIEREHTQHDANTTWRSRLGVVTDMAMS